jgi:hypothetical protein
MAKHDGDCGFPFDANVCARNVACQRGTLRPDAMTTLYACLATQACHGPGGDPCWAALAQSYARDPRTSSFQSKCAAKTSSCNTHELEDDCEVFGALTDAGRAAFEACIAGRCDDVEGCFKDAEYPADVCKK